MSEENQIIGLMDTKELLAAYYDTCYGDRQDDRSPYSLSTLIGNKLIRDHDIDRHELIFPSIDKETFLRKFD